MNLSYMVLLDMWNMFGQKILSFIGGYARVLYMSFHSYRVVFCAAIPTEPRNPDIGSCSMSYSL